VLKDDHPSTLLAMNDLAGILAVENKFDESEAINREALERRMRLFGPDDIGTLQSMNNLGNLLERRGKYAEAEQVLRQTVEARKRVLGSSHAHTLGSMVRLVRALAQQGKWDEVDVLLAELMQPANLEQLAPPAQAVVLARHGERLVQRKQFPEAERALLDARQRMGDDPRAIGRSEMLKALIRLYEETNRSDEAARFRAELSGIPSTQPEK